MNQCSLLEQMGKSNWNVGPASDQARRGGLNTKMTKSKTQRKSYKDKLEKKFKRKFYEPSRLSLIGSYLRSLGVQNAVFIWIPKSAGTSVLSALTRYGCIKLKKIHIVKYYFPQKGMVTFGHINYPELIKSGYVSRKFDESAYKFCFTRNPYDRAVSLFFYLKKIDRVSSQTTFLEFCRQLNDKGCEDIGLYNLDGWSHCNPQVRWIENLEMDFIGRFESLEADFNKILKDLKLPPVDLPHHNITSHEHFSHYYCQESKEIVENYYRKDFIHFGYKLDGI